MNTRKQHVNNTSTVDTVEIGSDCTCILGSKDHSPECEYGVEKKYEEDIRLLTEEIGHLREDVEKAREDERERAVDIIKDELKNAPLEVQMTKGMVFANVIKRIQPITSEDNQK